MSVHSAQATGPSPAASEGVTPSEARVRDLERLLERVEFERTGQARAVELELERLGTIYDRLRQDLDLARAERDEAVETARREREARAREALELSQRLELAQQAQLDGPGFVERFVAERMSVLPEEQLDLPEDGAPEIDGFRVFEPLGEGGMATVYRALRRSDGLEVALKLLRGPSRSSPARSELFLREAAVMLQLQHPSLVGALDAGESPYGRYLVLEFVDGEPMNHVVRRNGPLREQRALEVALEVAEALRYCRRAELIHRDVKPGNLILDREGRIKLCDFGLAVMSNDPGRRPFGSPGYAAPEQLVPGAEVDERADIYGLGCTLWHLVVGHRAFSGPAKAVFAEQREKSLPDPRFEGADISSSFAKVIRRMGRIAPAERYRSWDELILDLTLLRSGSPAFAAELSEALARSAFDNSAEPPPLAAESRQDEAASLEPVERNAPTQDAPYSEASLGPLLSWEDAPSVPTLPGPSPVRIDPVDVLDDVPTSETLAAPPLEALAPGAATAARRPSPEDPPQQRTSAVLVLTACLAAAAVGAFVEHRIAPRPVDVLIRNARTLAASGRAAEAADGLRNAATLLPPADAARVRSAADALAAR